MDKNEREALYRVKGYLTSTVENQFNTVPDEVVEYATKLLAYLEDTLEGKEVPLTGLPVLAPSNG